jgi:glycogen synthase
MRICFVSRRFFPTISGMSVYAANLLRELVQLGHDVTMVSQYRGDPLGTKVYGGGPPPPVPGVKVIGLESLGEQNGGDFERDVATIVQTVIAEHRQQPFDILHAQYGYPPGLAVLEASRELGLPNVVSIQGGDGHWVGTCCATHKAAMLAVLGHAGALLIGSRSFAEEVLHNHGTPVERFTIIPGAVDVERFRPRDGWRPGALRDGQRPVVLYHGRVDRRKGVLDLLDAWALLRQARGDTAQLVISGIGPDSDAAAARVAELALHESVVLRGYAAYDAVPQIYHTGDIFVSPTYAEGFSNTILEAMAAGLPIVSTATVGVVDCLRHDENALLHTPSDVPALARLLERMLDDEALRTRLAQAAYHEVQRLYAWPTVARQIVAVYEQLRGTRPDIDWSADVPLSPCRFRATPHLL